MLNKLKYLILLICVSTLTVSCQSQSNLVIDDVYDNYDNTYQNTITDNSFNYNNIHRNQWIECAIHGGHDLAYFDISYNPLYCRPNTSFLAWNSVNNTHWNYSWNTRYVIYGTGIQYYSFYNPYRYYNIGYYRYGRSFYGRRPIMYNSPRYRYTAPRTVVRPRTQPSRPRTQPRTQPSRPRTQPSRPRTQPRTQPSRPRTQPRTQPSRPRTQPSRPRTQPRTQPSRPRTTSPRPRRN